MIETFQSNQFVITPKPYENYKYQNFNYIF